MIVPRVLAFAAIACGVLCAQKPAMVFEVASIKPAEQQKGPGFRIMMKDDDGRITWSNVSLKSMLQRAYKVKPHQISGPDWMETERFDVNAKFPEGAKKDDVPEMLKALLADRFKLTLHTEQKVAPVYALVPGKTGLKVKPAEGEASGGVRMSMSPKGRKMSGDVKLAALADFLSNMLDRPVLDQTGIGGTYKVELEWTPDGSEKMGGGMVMMRGPGPGGPGGGPDAEKHANEGADAPTIFTAVQEQLGLRLEAKKAPIDMFVVDHIQKTPTGN